MSERIQENPYMSARREWNERYGGYISRARTSQIVAVFSLAIATAAVGGLIYSTTQSRLIPYVIQVDSHGRAVSVGPAAASNLRDQRIVKAALADTIVNLRSVMVDAAAQRRALDSGYAHVAGASPAKTALDEYFGSGGNPFERAKRETVTVEIQTPLPLSADSYQIEWLEVVRDRKGKAIKTLRMKAIATVAFIDAPDEKTIIMNPGGVYIRDLSWSQQF